MPGVTPADHQARLERLVPARSLCASFAEQWKIAHCSALALRDTRKAEYYKKQAALNGVGLLSCEQGSAVAPPVVRQPLSPYVREKYALVVGIGRFQDAGISPLKYTAKDAEDFAEVLVQHAQFEPENVKLLAEEMATRANILSELQQLILVAEEEDLVVLYISTHGSPNRQGQGLQGIGYIVTHDTTLSEVWVDAIEYQDLARKASLIKARRMITFLDTCFSGQAFRADGSKQLVSEGLGVGRQTADLFVSGEGTYVITSSRFDERSWESEELANSYFTYYLMEALRSGPDPPSIQTVFDELSRKVIRAVARDKGVGQHPQIHPQDGLANIHLGVSTTRTLGN